MIGFILTCIVITAISMALAGLPSIVLYILLEMKGLGSYVLALTVLMASIVELTQFVFHVFLGTEVDLSIKNLLKIIKSPFNKKNKDIKKMINKTKNKSLTIDAIEVIVIIGFVIYAIFVPIHGLLVSIIYKNIFARVLAIIFFPLIICNSINAFREDMFGFIGTIFIEFFLPLLACVITATSVMFIADVWHEDISKSIQSWFIYDDKSYDEIRKREDFKGEYEFLKSSYEKTYNELITTCDINEPSCLEKIGLGVIQNTKIKQYGYSVSSWYRSPEIDYICVLDNKTKKYKFYKLNYKNFAFELSDQEEFETVQKDKK